MTKITMKMSENFELIQSSFESTPQETRQYRIYFYELATISVHCTTYYVTHTHTHTCIYIYVSLRVYECVCK